MNVLVYAGPGVSAASLGQTLACLRALVVPRLAVRTINASALAKHPWAPTCALLVIPGGRDIPYLDALSDPSHTADPLRTANHAIRSYVSAGGNFLGICAGAYYASAQIVWESGRTGFQVIGPRPLAFFPGTAHGCVFPGFSYDSESGARAVSLVLDDASELHGIYYNGGPEFVDADRTPGVRVLARFVHDGDASKAAAVMCNVGHGRAVLWGPHPEFTLVTEPAISALAARHVMTHEQLLQAEGQRWSFVRSCLKHLGVCMPSDGQGAHIPAAPSSTLPLLLVSATQDIGLDISASLSQIAGPDHLPLEDRHNTVHFHCTTSENDVSTLLDSAHANQAPTAEPSENGNATEKAAVHIALASLAHLSRKHTRLFDIQEYFAELQRTQKLARSHADPPGAFDKLTWGAGAVLLYGEVVESTQTLLDQNPAMCAALPVPLLVLASQQRAGRGRGGNAWVSPAGALLMSLLLRVPRAALPPARLTFVQYIFGIAVVQACRAALGPDAGPRVRLKWPNDVYVAADAAGADGMKKLGGVLVGTNFRDGTVDLIIGCGLNVLNDLPTTSLASLADPGAAPTLEGVAAAIVARFDDMWHTFVRGGGAFEPFMAEYLSYWLHTDQEVTLTATTPHKRVRIQGITPDHGLLRTVPVDDAPQAASTNPFARQNFIDLQPDGNSFDMFSGLIRTKS